MEPQYVSEKEAAIITGLAVKTLSDYRYRSVGPVYMKIGRAVRYKVVDLGAWMDRHAVGVLTD